MTTETEATVRAMPHGRVALYCPRGHEVVSASVTTSTGRRLVANDLADESCGYGACGWAGA